MNNRLIGQIMSNKYLDHRMSSLKQSQFCYSRYDIKDTLFFEASEEEFIEFMDSSDPAQPTITEKLKSFLREIDSSYNINFVLIITEKLSLISTLVNSGTHKEVRKRNGILYTEPIRTVNKNTLLYLLEFDNSDSQLVEKVLISILPMVSNIIIQSTYPLQNDHLTHTLRLINGLKKWQNQLSKMKQYLPQLILVLKSQSQQEYLSRNKSLDEQILKDYFKFSDENKINKFIKQQFEGRDLVVVAEHPTSADPEINFLRMKIIRYQTKPPSFFNCNNQALISYITYVLNNLDSPNLDFRAVSKAVTSQTIQFKPVGPKPDLETTYNVWSQQIDNFFLSKFPSHIAQKIIHHLNTFDKQVQTQLEMVKGKRISDKASLICLQEKRLQSFLNQPLMTELCVACGFDYSEIKGFIEDKIIELENREEEMEISNLYLDSFYSGNK